VERRSGLPLALAVVSLRILALSLVLSVFTPYALALDAAPFAADANGRLLLVGVAFGAYALAAALLQVPFGLLADRWNRKGAILLGLGLTAAGSVVAAYADHVVVLAIARFVSGAGAVNGIAMALAAESGEPTRRTRRMALMGAAIGGTFTLGLVLGPLLAPAVGVPGLFLAQGALAIFALAAVAVSAVPAPAPMESAEDPAVGSRGLYGAGFVVNASLAAVLLVFPLEAARHLPPAEASRLLAVAVVAGGFAMFAGARLADRGRAGVVLAAATAALGLGAALVASPVGGLPAVALGAFVFFAGQSTLSALLPSLLARRAGPGRAAPQGALSTAMSLGTFAGGVVAGALYGLAPPALAVLLVAAAAGAAWVATEREVSPRASPVPP